ncbi:MAG: hexitol phosphatase HxpB [Bacteroidota bacterium]|nr:hexitol phosphatase HxpB [Bacteroidota bacterium]
MLNTVIFDMDGLLIDSEPLWEEAGKELLQRFNVQLTPQQYHSSTGLGTSTWIEHWFNHFNIDQAHAADAATSIVASAIQKIEARALPMPGVGYILGFFKQRGFKIGLASSSPMRLIDSVVRKLGIDAYIEAKASAEHLPYSKPHPQVFLDCAASLGSAPQQCICFEDSFNGMIAAKAARMKCVVVPAYAQQQDSRWAAADLKLSSLQNFNDLLLHSLG